VSDRDRLPGRAFDQAIPHSVPSETAGSGPGHTLDPAEATVLAVFAHPDDESLACGGTLACLSDLGAKVILLCLSRGERGFVSDPRLISQSRLGDVRTRELHAAAHILGAHMVHVLDYPDGRLRWMAGLELETEILNALRQHTPDAVITFDEDGLYWHPDHVAVHERTTHAVLSLGAEAPSLYYVTMAPGAMRRVTDDAISKCWVPPANGLWSIQPDAFGLANPTPTFSIDLSKWVPRKLAALQCHVSQMGVVNPFSLLGETEASTWLGVEYFRRATNCRPGPALLEQLTTR
jgi:N-acetyl-1-D-myo-inositol-2-amino-2-deoxy-alpha-D-glucopyranoside deacetylase